jgi:hypothetical protein
MPPGAEGRAPREPGPRREGGGGARAAPSGGQGRFAGGAKAAPLGAEAAPSGAGAAQGRKGGTQGGKREGRERKREREGERGRAHLGDPNPAITVTESPSAQGGRERERWKRGSCCTGKLNEGKGREREGEAGASEARRAGLG